MKIIILLSLLINLVFPFTGKIMFNDGTTIKGTINNVNANYASITPEGLSFAEEIIVSNIDTLKLDDGKLLITSNEVLFFLNNGKFSEPSKIKESSINTIKETFEIEYVIVPNWSANIYTGYPIPFIRGESFEYYDQIYPTLGLSLGSPYGIFIGDFFMNIIGELAYYKFSKSTDKDIDLEDLRDPFEGFAFQIGLSPGLFIGDYSISMTAATGIYHAGPGFIGGISVDVPLGTYILNKFGNMKFIENYEEYIQSMEMRITTRANLVKKNDGLWTYWLGGGISFGYEF
tara:strand:+ start:151 stop:1014 length:864 start_codon:yes stop_codon:yes gene_type:complete